MQHKYYKVITEDLAVTFVHKLSVVSPCSVYLFYQGAARINTTRYDTILFYRENCQDAA